MLITNSSLLKEGFFKLLIAAVIGDITTHVVGLGRTSSSANTSLKDLRLRLGIMQDFKLREDSGTYRYKHGQTHWVHLHVNINVMQ